MESFCPEKQVCPSCNSQGNCKIHAYYSRRIIDFIHGTPMASAVTVLRLACKSCGHTHAVLPDHVVPYLNYGLFFILRVLGEAFLKRSSLERLCERFHITLNQFYHWKSLWMTHKREWLGLLEDADTSGFSFLKWIVAKISYSTFAAEFTAKTGISFLQSHRNPDSPPS